MQASLSVSQLHARDERINLVLGIKTSFDQSYDVFLRKLRYLQK